MRTAECRHLRQGSQVQKQGLQLPCFPQSLRHAALRGQYPGLADHRSDTHSQWLDQQGRQEVQRPSGTE